MLGAGNQVNPLPNYSVFTTIGLIFASRWVAVRCETCCSFSRRDVQSHERDSVRNISSFVALEMETELGIRNCSSGFIELLTSANSAHRQYR